MADDKTEEPTEKKLDDAKKKGNSPKSQDVNAAANMLVLTICLGTAVSSSSEHLAKLFRLAFEGGIQALKDNEVAGFAFDIALEGIWIVLPFLAASVITGFIAGFMQVGVIISIEPLAPKFDKLNPAEGMKKLMSVKSIIELIKALLKAIVMGAVVWKIAIGLIPLLVGASSQTPGAIGHIAWSAIQQLFGAAAVVFIVIGPADLAYQKWQFIRDNRMKKDEIIREHKESEGDPQIKADRKQLAQELSELPPRARVPGASVVITNPTHFAVALQYHPGKLPFIVAKGADTDAALIRSIAEASGVPIVGNPPLARALFKLPLDAPVPENLFEAVATVLQWVASLDRHGSPDPSTYP
jgi:type III secretion protein U